MKKIYLMVGMWAALFNAKAQQTATFEEIELQSDSYYNGSDGAGGFHSGGIWFPNNYNAGWGSWSGFSVSNMKDTVTAGYENQYSAITGGGADSSGNYAVVYFPGDLKLQFESPVKVEGFHITNSVYAYLSMRNGDDLTKKFGGPDGSEPDYFLLLVSGTDAAGNLSDTVEFYLADFRSEDSEDDFIVDDWQWLDLSSLGVVSELNFSLESSDTADWGMNTPAYFCIDNFTLSDITSVAGRVPGANPELRVYPNPVVNNFHIELPVDAETIRIVDPTGKLVLHRSPATNGKMLITELADMPSGLYFVKVKTVHGIITEKIIKY